MTTPLQPFPPIPPGERDRLAALQRYELLDTPAEAAFDRITRLAAKLLKVPIALISLIDHDRQWFKSRIGLAVQETPREHAFCHHALESDALFVVGDARVDPRFATNPLVTGDPHIRFYAGAPLRTADGMALGTICVIDNEPRPPLSPEEEEALRDLSAMVMAHIEARRAVGYLHPVTSLSNRFRFLADLDALLGDRAGRERTADSAPPVTIVVVDAAASHQYAELTRVLGQVCADAFEIDAARRIADCLPANTKLYHLSPARFACILTRAAEPAGMLDRLGVGIRHPFHYDGVPIGTSGGIGIVDNPGDGTGSVELLRAATSAAYQSLEEQKPWCAYDAARDRASLRAFSLLRSLTDAIGANSGGQLHVVFQPKVDLRTHACVGAEALLRWTHPELGPISPGEFVPLAERTALVRSLTEWVIDTVLVQVAQWRHRGIDLPVSINISMLDLAASDFAERVEAMLRRHGVQADWIDFEVTESALMTDRAEVDRQLGKLGSLGIEVEIDDFGTGQSALSYLKDIPATAVKIDQRFIRSLASERSDQIMVRSTIEMAHELGYQVVAEGVETREVFDWLRQHGCDFGQGYLFSRPLAPQAFEGWVTAGAFRPDLLACPAAEASRF
ncbi:EAL domain-containing protein (putative c-di-GMP-specific phosphodiesterase class I)/GAF domain-containing protein [Azospirillum picis]|uniref:EAL domain-containing protein (Putative c-di-GMP-specific phosphodiesterase class I)/GAF domain-containing protein n=1 Tax=Azospirillum picis TaxID=488438 RepID=A0ABU0MN00_9PROT|nr:EAL domain-containing protein [Azospirillum picis]MBP2300660.1 EAL domain-containing protein (putative c-di-GMP-specific phosphodiesterase class I)/GAF domain-containing protein [Azospirillum picis]MDQ0534629.1 EAL domain-containing protein (putative c-di-GMP-specific phosphodiesterase class I)/GAF domain-containing protein [Azospirillum picis]